MLSLLALAAGATSAFAFAPYDLWPLAIIGIAALLALIGKAATPGTAFRFGWLFGTGHFSVGLTWIATAFTFQAKMPAMLGWVAVVLLAMFLALYIGTAVLVTHRLGRTAIGRIFVLAAAWMLAEWLRGWVLSGFAWNPLGAATLPIGAIGQYASIVGALGLSGLVVLLGGALWALVEPRATAMQRRLAGLVFAIVGLLAILGPLKGEAAPANAPMIFVVQPNIGQDVK